MGQVINFLIIAICLYFAIRGLFFGFVSGIFSLLAYVISYFAAVMLAPVLIQLVKENIAINELLIQIISYVVIFLLSYIIIKIIEMQVARITNTSILSGLNRVSGIILGLLQGIVVVVFIDFLLQVQPVFEFSSFLNSSSILMYLRDMSTVVHQYIRTVIPSTPSI